MGTSTVVQCTSVLVDADITNIYVICLNSAHIPILTYLLMERKHVNSSLTILVSHGHHPQLYKAEPDYV